MLRAPAVSASQQPTPSSGPRPHQACLCPLTRKVGQGRVTSRASPCEWGSEVGRVRRPHPSPLALLLVGQRTRPPPNKPRGCLGRLAGTVETVGTGGQGWSPEREQGARVRLGSSFHLLVAHVLSSAVSFLPRNALLSQNICNMSRLDCFPTRFNTFLTLNQTVAPRGPPGWDDTHIRGPAGPRPLDHDGIRELGPSCLTPHACTHMYTHPTQCTQHTHVHPHACTKHTHV